MRCRSLRIVSGLLVGALLSAGCASSGRRGGLNSRFIRLPDARAPAASSPYDAGPPADSFEATITKIRELSVRARPAPKYVSGPTVESFDPALAAALLVLNTVPSAESHRRVAREYARLGIFDAAYRNYRAAIAIDSRDAAAYDGLARLWRDAGLPSLAVGDANRAVYFAPGSPEARNTLGTVLQALGQNRQARRAYESALTLQPGAAFALNNLGYLALLEGNAAGAVSRFRAALAADSTLVAASHNLAVAYAAADRLDLARAALVAADAGSRADYNLGIIHLALGDRGAALRAFDVACRAPDAQPMACQRANTLRSRPVGGGLE